jgi:hypothetical protein
VSKPEFKSWKSFQDFERAVNCELRFVRKPETDQFLEAVRSTSQKRVVAVKEGHIFWRAQLGHDWREEGDEERFEVPCAHPIPRMKPLRDRAPDGRANPKGIPCLYLASRKETAISEVRPWIGSYVSLAQFTLLRSVRLIDCSHDHAKPRYYFDEPEPEKREVAVWADIDEAFAEPMTRSDDSADYAPTQILAELFKLAGLDGVAYRSKFGENGHNIALFDIEAADLLNCGLYRVDNINMEFSEQDNPYFASKYLTKHS